MNILTLFLILLTPVFICLVIIYLSYKIPEIAGNKKLGTLLSILATITILYFVVHKFYPALFLTKHEVISLLQDEDIILNNDFKIESCQSNGLFTRNSIHFTLKISKEDHARLRESIQNMNYFGFKKPFLGKDITSYYQNQGEDVIEIWRQKAHILSNPSHILILLNHNRKTLTYKDVETSNTIRSKNKK